MIYNNYIHELNYHFRWYNIDNISCGKRLMNMNLTGTLGEMCMSEYNNNNLCIGRDLDYRSPDGSCNNLKRNYFGKANTAYKRVLPPAYTDGKFFYFFCNINHSLPI